MSAILATARSSGRALDARFAWVPAWPFGLSGTQTALQTIITLILSFIVFTFASLLVAIQVASGQLTPRKAQGRSCALRWRG